MSYQVNRSAKLRPSTSQQLGYIMDTSGLRMTTGDPGLDNLIKYGFWFGLAMALYKAYGMLRYNEPIFSGGTPPAWKM